MPLRSSGNDFPRWSLLFALGLTVAVILGLGGLTAHFHWHAHEAHQRSHRLGDLRGQILRYDEALTMSARMGAVTGAFRWEKRYHASEAKLERAFDAALELAPSLAEARALRQTRRANRELVALEHRAFALAYQGRRPQAQDLLAGAAYRRLKAAYAQGMEKLHGLLETEEEQAFRAEKRSLNRLSLLGGIGLLLLGAAWGTAFRGLYRWQEGRAHNRDQLLASLGEGVFGVDREGLFTFLNPAALALLGYEDEQAVLGRNSHRLTHHTDAEGDPYPEAECPIYRVMATGGPLEAWQDRFWRADGTSFPVEVHANPVRGASAGVEGAVVAFSDITERKSREEALRKYRTAFEQSRDAVMFLDRGRFLDGNPAALELFRVPSVEAFRGYHPTELSPEYQPDGDPSREVAQDRIEEAYTDGQAFFEWCHQTTDGEDFPAEVQLSRIELGDRAILEAVVRDITQQKKAFERVREARDRAQEYFEVARVMMLVLDPEGRVAAINQRGCELLELSQDEIVGQDWFGRFLPEEIRAEVQPFFDRLMRGEVEVAEYGENEVVTGTGKRRLVAFRNGLLRDSEGRIEGILSSGADVTKQRELEAQLERQAAHDALTGLYNRRAFQEHLERERKRACRHGSPLCLVMFDIDHFKAVNDTYGHLQGDEILRKLAGLVQGRLRGGDLVARWGGEEFMILLPETDREGGECLAEDLRREVASDSFPGPDRLTISVGVAELHREEGTDDLIKRADDAMYAAKENGRNRTECA
jgi:diguanylate cyclase (GGDEF)-like protein/PAS domain S-box-containing protein